MGFPPQSTVHTEWQWPLSGVHSIMMVKSAQACKQYSFSTPPWHFFNSRNTIYFIQNFYFLPAITAGKIVLKFIYFAIYCPSYNNFRWFSKTICVLGNVNSIHNKWDLTFHIETNFGALSSVLDTLAEQIRQHGDTLTKFAERKEMNGNTCLFFNRSRQFLYGICVQLHW